MQRTVLGFVASLTLLVATAGTARAQIVPAPRSAAGTRVATLRETLTNTLRATTHEQQEFLLRVEQATTQRKLDPKLVLAVMRYAQRRNPAYPFPYFELAMRFEASKRNVHLPPAAVIASTAFPRHH